MSRHHLRLASLAALTLALQVACGDDSPTSTSPLDAADDGADATGDGNGDAGIDGPDSADSGDHALLDAPNDDAGDALADTTDSADADGAGDAADTADAQDAPALDVPLEPFTECLDTPFVFTPSGEWEHPWLTGMIAWQNPGHSVEDRVATLPWDVYELEGKFAYGVFGNDLEDEWVRAWIDTCVAWEALGRARTDSDGRVRFELPRHVLPGPGRYAVRMAVEVDASVAEGYVLVVPSRAQLVVFDVDGTLTTSDSELFSDYFSDLFGGDFVPEAYEGAVALVSAYAEAGWEILYLTGRPYWLDRITRGWLGDEGFPLGTLHLTRTLSESLPTEGAVGTYKRDWLEGLLTHHTIFRAYGNATTDIYAYREAGIDVLETFIIGENAGLEGTQPISSYPEHLDGLTVPEAHQPWLD
jgi:hypothetical protein